MNRLCLLSLAAIAALVAAGCEKHNANELAGEEGLYAVKESSPVRPDAPKAPTEIPTNPGGAAPVKPGNDKGQTAESQATNPPAPKTEAPAFFPGSK